MKTLVTIAFAFISILSFAQTDIIEMRSRNASLKKFEIVSKIESSDPLASNFGMLPPDRNTQLFVFEEMSMAVLDSVKCVSDDVVIMYTSNVCTKTPLTPSNGTIWKAGADTVFNHPLFSKRHSLDSVKAVLDRDYIFNSPSDSTKFIGFDNDQGTSNEGAVHPVENKREKKNSIGWELIFMLITPMLFVLAVNRFVLPMSSIPKQE